MSIQKGVLVAERTALPQAFEIQRFTGYTPGLRVGPFVYVSGRIGWTAEGEMAAGGAGAQARQAIVNMAAVLEQLGASLSDVVRTRVYLVDMNDLEAIAEAHGDAFGDLPPTNGAFAQVVGLFSGALVEIECDAILTTTETERCATVETDAPAGRHEH